MIHIKLILQLVGIALALSGTPAKAGSGVAGDEQGVRYFPHLNKELVSDQAADSPQAGQPIIWIVIDATRPDHLTPYGYQRATSPALDALAKEGVIFTRFFANAPWTRPATTTMLTGVIPAEHRVQCDWHKLPQDVPTVAEQLQKAGYTTLAVVGNGNASSAFHLDRGFDEFHDTRSDWKGLPNAKQVLDLGLELLKKHRREKKVFLFLFLVDPHDPYRPGPPYDNMFYPEYKGPVRHRVHWEYKNHYPEAQRKKIVALYDGLIRSTDDQLARFFEGLRKLGFWDESSLFVTADHGESFGEHNIYLHAHHQYETHLRIPLIIRAPWIRERGRYSSAFLQQIDLAPTFLQLAGAAKLPEMKGLSIVDALADRSRVPVPRYLISEYKCYGIHRSAIRTRRYKLIYQQPADRKVFLKHIKDPKFLPSVSFDKPVFHLYDELADPFEKNNIWASDGERVGKRLLPILKAEIEQDEPSKRLKKLDPELVEQLRSLGYMQ